MRRPVNRAARIQTVSIPPPVGGLNTLDAVANMAPTDAVIMDNYFPGTADVGLRNGYQPWGSGIAGNVETLAGYNGGAVRKMFAIAAGSVFDVTANGPIGPAVVSGLSNSRFQSVNFGNAGAQFLVQVNGVDNPLVFDGTDWKRMQRGEGADIASINAQIPGSAIASITASGTTATLTTSAPHGLTSGEVVQVSGATPAAYNGSFVIVVTNATAFTYVTATAPGAAASPVGSYLLDGTTATLTTATPHGLATDDSVTIVGATPTQYNGTYTITVTGPTTFTYEVDVAPGGPATVMGAYTINGAYVLGVDPSTFINVQVFASRIWFVVRDSMQVYYLPVGQIGGQAQVFDITAQTTLGGSIMGLCTWNVDNTAGLNPYLVFVTTEGEAVVYMGSDPSQATGFSISARFRIAPPVGRRFYEKVGSDLVLITGDGLVPLSKALLTDRSQPSVDLTQKISPSVNADVASYGDNFGWQPVLYPDGNKIIVNVPTTEDAESRQYVMNTITSAWCRFTGWNAFCFCYFDKKLFFGGASLVAQADSGQDDGGQPINADIKAAFNYFGQRGTQKYFKFMRPVFLTTSPIAPQIDLSVDFSNQLPSSTPTFSLGSTTPWDTTPWDAVPWGGQSLVQTDWESIEGIAYAATYRMRTQTKGISYSIASTDFKFEPQQSPTL